MKTTPFVIERTFDAPTSDFTKENFVNGWTSLIGTLLKDFVEKREIRS